MRLDDDRSLDDAAPDQVIDLTRRHSERSEESFILYGVTLENAVSLKIS
jgi:hypothetical protein